MIFCTDRTNPFKKTSTSYTPKEIDYFFLYCIENKWCGLISVEEFSSKVLKINLNKPLNNNYHLYKMHDDYCFDRKIYEIIYNKKIENKKRVVHEISVKKKDVIKRRNGDLVYREDIKKKIKDIGFICTGKEYGVTDNCVRKWCKTFGLPITKKDILNYSDEEWELI